MSTPVAALPRVLARQLARCGIDPSRGPDPAQWARFLDLVAGTYEAEEQQRYTAERALEVSTREMEGLHRRLAAERERLAGLLRSLPEAVVQVLPGGRVEFANPAASELLGVRVGEVFGPVLMRSDGSAVDPFGLGPGPVAEAHGRVRIGPRALEVAWHVEPLGENGLVVVVSDTREVRRREAALERARNVAEMSRQTVQARGRLLASVSHELRTPLNAILGYTELLQEDADPESAADLERIAASGRHLLSLINDLLDLSRVDAGRMEVELVEVVLEDVVRDALATAEPLVRKQGNRLRVEQQPVGAIRTDPRRLGQCLINLLGNAAKFTEGGEVTLLVRRAGSWVELEVRDTGVGIGPEHLERVFDAFEQVRPTDGRGTGLGLALTRAFVRLLGGSIGVTSELGVGSSFTLTIPGHCRILSV